MLLQWREELDSRFAFVRDSTDKDYIQNVAENTALG